MNEIIKIAIYIHAALGAIGLISGTLIYVLKKGNSLHKKVGNIFYFSMIISCTISMIITFLPSHENAFLFLIGCLTVYLLITGKRALQFRSKNQNTTKFDLTILLVMLGLSIMMLVFGAILLMNGGDGSILFLFFGVLSFYLTYRDYVFLRNIEVNRKKAITSHIGKMSGAYISSVTAFLVAGLHLQGIIYWVTPSFLGTLLIIHYSKKYSHKKQLNQLAHE